MPTPVLFASLINSYLPEPHSSLLSGILFGIPLNTSKIFYQELKAVGLLHIVVLSGMNITILCVIIGGITEFLGKRISVLLTILTVILFICFVGPQAPVIRAGIMGILTLVAIIYGRKTTVIYSLLLSLIPIAIFWPQWLTTLSLHLSYGATLGLTFFGSVSPEKTPTRSSSISYTLWKEIKPALAAQVFTAPLIFLHFKQISLISPLSNLLVAFLIPPLMIFGFIMVILGKMHYELGVIPSYVCFGILHYMVLVIETLAKLPFSFIQFS